MSNKKKVIVVNLMDQDLKLKFVENGFMYAIENDTLRVEQTYLYSETESEIYKISISDFFILSRKSIKDIYEKLEDAVKIENLNSADMEVVYQWLNPVFEQIGSKDMIRFASSFEEKIKTNEDYHKVVRDCAYKQALGMDIEKRKRYVDRFTDFGIFNEKDKLLLEYYADAPMYIINSFCEKENLSYEEKVILVSQIYHYERNLEKKKNNNSKKVNSKIVSAMNLLEGTTIADTYLHNDLSDEEFSRTIVTKSDILQLPYSLIMDYLENRNDRVPERLKITSKDLVNSYGRFLSGDTIYKFVLYGYITPQDFIGVYEINKVLSRIDADMKGAYTTEELKEFYKPEILIKMRKSNSLTPEFIEKYLEMQDFENNPEIYREKSILLADEVMKDEEENPQDEILDFFNIGFCDLETAKGIITPKYIERKFENGEINKEEIFDFYQKGLIDGKIITKYYTDREILDLYESGKIARDCLSIIRDGDNIIEDFCQEKLEPQDLIRLYLGASNFTVTDLADAFELAEKEEDISAYIDESTPFSKIKELFSNLLIDYASVLRLKDQGVINEEQFAEIKETLDTKKFFEEIKSGKKYKVVTSRQVESVGKKRTTESSEKSKKDFSDEMTLISRILGKDVESDSYGTIESYNVKGKPTTLNDYRIFGNEALDGIIILQKSKKGNAVFVMNVLQMMYFLKGRENEDGEFEIQDRMKDKAYLKTIEGVEVVEHTKYFGRNLIEASARVSETVARSTKVDDKKYKEDVDKMIKEMTEKYLYDRGIGRND